ncbi:MAG: hypothetical protein KF753_11830 [Caldilineaceae bacterium]|nr:hypothetical protein [Caldilineaceae bacterium]
MPLPTPLLGTDRPQSRHQRQVSRLTWHVDRLLWPMNFTIYPIVPLISHVSLTTNRFDPLPLLHRGDTVPHQLYHQPNRPPSPTPST